MLSLVVFLFTAAAVFGQELDCESAETRTAVGRCLRPWLDRWELLRAHQAATADLVFPLVYYDRDAVLGLCDLFVEASDGCLSDERLNRCSDDHMISFARSHMSYYCSADAIAALPSVACLMKAADSNSDCRAHIRGIPLPSHQASKCIGMPAYHACLAPVVKRRCGNAGADVFVESINAFGCSVDGGALTSTGTAAGGASLGHTSEEEFVPVAFVDSVPADVDAATEGSGSLSDTTDVPGAFEFDFVDTASADVTGATEGSRISLGEDSTTAFVNTPVDRPSSPQRESTSERPGTTAFPETTTGQARPQADVKTTMKWVRGPGLVFVKVSKTPTKLWLTENVPTSAPVTASEPPLDTAEPPLETAEPRLETVRGPGLVFVKVTKTRAPLPIETVPTSAPVTATDPPLDTAEPPLDTVVHETTTSIEPETQQDPDFALPTPPQLQPLLPAQPQPQLGVNPIVSPVASASTSSASSVASTSTVPATSTTTNIEITERATSTSTAGTTRPPPQPAASIAAAKGDVKEFKKTTAPARTPSGETRQSGCTAAQQRQIGQCLLPLSNRLQEIHTRVPAMAESYLPLYNYSTSELLDLCDILAITLEECLDPSLIAHCSQNELLQYVDSTLGFACGAADKTDFFLTFDCVHEVARENPDCYENIAGPNRPGPAPEKCRGFPEYYNCMETPISTRCSSDSLRMFLGTILYFGCEIVPEKKDQVLTAPVIEQNIENVVIDEPIKLPQSSTSRSTAGTVPLVDNNLPSLTEGDHEERPPNNLLPEPRAQGVCSAEKQALARSCLLPMMRLWSELRARKPLLNTIAFPVFYYPRTELLELCDAYANAFLCAGGIGPFAACINDELVRFANHHWGYLCSPPNVARFLRNYDCLHDVAIDSGTDCFQFIRGPSVPGEDDLRCVGLPDYHRCMSNSIDFSCQRGAMDEFEAAIRQFGCAV